MFRKSQPSVFLSMRVYFSVFLAADVVASKTKIVAFLIFKFMNSPLNSLR